MKQGPQNYYDYDYIIEQSQQQSERQYSKMGNTCTAKQDDLKELKQPTEVQNTPPNPKTKIITSGSSGFVPQMNALLWRSDHSKVGLRSQYIQQKVLDQEMSIGQSHLEIFTNLLRTQLKGNLFLHHHEKRGSRNIKQSHQNVKELDKKLSQQNIEHISQILNTHFLFLQLNSIERTQTIKEMKVFQAEQNSFIFKQGDNAERFFIISSGQVEILIDGESKKKLGKNKSFGEIALLFGTKRTASVRALTPCVLWGIDGDSFKRIVNEINVKTEQQNRQFLQKTNFFNDLTPIQQQSVMNVIVTLEYKPGQTIVSEGSHSNSFYIIKSGDVIVESKNGQETEISAGNEFGEKSFGNCTGNGVLLVKAKTQCTIICVVKENISDVLGSSIEDVIIKNRIKKIIENSKRFRVVSHKSLNYLFDDFEVKLVTQGEKLMKKGHLMKCLHIPLDITMSSADKKYQPGDIIQQNLLVEGKPLNHGVKADNSGSVLIIKPHPNILKEVRNFHSAIDPTQLKLDNIQIVKKIGSGQFGEVFAGIHLGSNSLVAIKSVSKKTVQKYRISRQIINQHLTMKKINNPYLVKYHKTFVSSTQIHFIIEYIQGEEFFDIIRKIGLLKTNQAQFYVAQILLALQYLHEQNIIYRDLKPENIMVEKSGYLKLIDMGTAKTLDKESYYKTRTVIGTPHYMAPEVISGKGYSALADLWSLGIVLFQLVVGHFPYQQKHNDPFEIYKLIMNKSLQFPGYIKDIPVKEMITKLLSKTPDARMNKGYNELKKMSFFSGLNWQDLQNKKLPAVYKISEDAGIDITKIQRENLQTMLEHFDNKELGNQISMSSKFLDWERQLLEEDVSIQLQ